MEEAIGLDSVLGGGRSGHVHATFHADDREHAPWVVDGATITCAMNQPYLVEIDIRTDRAHADPAALLGAASELRVVRAEHENGYGGVVSSVRTLDRGETGVRARVTLEPALAALRNGRDTRIFQDLTVPEVLEQVLSAELRAYGRTIRQELRRTYPKREYTVQYQESHFDFVHRLMEEEGILYYFTQENALETLVMIDNPAQYPRVAAPFLQYSAMHGGGGALEEESIEEFEPIVRMGGTKIATRHFDWTHPSAMILGETETTGGARGPVRESYQHDEAFTLHHFAHAYRASDVQDQVRLRREQQLRPQGMFQGRGTITGLRTGGRFELNGHPHGLDGSYVLVQVRHHVLGHVARASGADGEAARRYQNVFTAIPAESPWRPQRTRTRPRIQGIQTAIVTGPPGEEIHCDDNGRIKVQFHWDRQGHYNEHSSCWVRVMQTSAGSGFGAWVLPRVGWEVVVAFVDGDPDRPLVTGCLYNGDQPLPYPLPAKKALTLFKSNSYPGGNGSNELRMDDSKHAEEIYLHGEKDWNTVIEHDATLKIGHDETDSVGNNRTRTVGVNETLSVGANRTRSVGANETVSISANSARTVGANDTLGVSANQQVAIGANGELSVGGDRQVAVTGNQSVKVGASESYQIGSSSDRKVGGSANEKVGKLRKRKVGLVEMVNVGVAQMVNAGMARMVSAGLVHMINAGLMLKLNAGMKLQLACGPSKITLTKAGVSIEGAKVTVTAKSITAIKGGQVITLN